MKKFSYYVILLGMKAFAYFVWVYCVVIWESVCYAAGFLKAETFPGTFQDLSFETRMDVLADGYDGFEATFDSSGKCISGCPYRGITLQQMQQLSSENTNAGNAYINAVGANAGANVTVNPTVSVPITLPPPQNSPSGGIVSETQMPPVAEQTGTVWPNTVITPQWKCERHSNIIRITNSVPVQAPLDGNLVITSDFGSRDAPTSGASTWHSGIDLLATTGTPVYASASGRVRAMPGGACGLGLELDHGNGFVTKYCHLSARVVSIGDVIQAGCHIGNVGNTGVSTGAHLHYAIMYNGKPFDPLYPENRLGRSYSMPQMSSGRPNGTILPGRI